MFSAASLKAEPEQQLLIPIPDLIRFRRHVLKKATDQPDIVVVTASGWLDTKHPAWNTDRKKLVATSKSGLPILMASLKSQLEVGEHSTSDSVHQWLETNQVTVKSFETDREADVDFVALTKFLKNDWKVQYLDVSAGPTLISLMVKAYVSGFKSFWNLSEEA